MDDNVKQNADKTSNENDFVHETFMRKAIEQAKKAYELNEVPVGAVIVRNGEIISYGFNKRETDKNALMHAEIDAINNACKALNGWRLWECEIYVTLEPCAMCAGAIVNARIPNVYFGAYDVKNGCCGSVADVMNLQNGYHPQCFGGVLETECKEILGDFFKNLRRNRNKKQ